MNSAEDDKRPIKTKIKIIRILSNLRIYTYRALFDSIAPLGKNIIVLEKKNVGS